MAEWHVVYENVLPYVVQIETPEGFGTGFLFAFNDSKDIVAFATAAHVVEHADSWKLPLKIRHHVSGNEIFVSDQDRIIDVDSSRDSASIIIRKPGGYFPDSPMSTTDPTKFMKIGVEVAWVGYPGIARPHLCLFTGTIAAFVSSDDSYLIDGVAINGISGGPVFSALADGTPNVLGTISAYMPNRQRGDALPGMMRAQDLTSFQETIKKIESIDEARAQKEKEEQERRQAEASAEAPPATIEPSTTEAERPTDG